MNLACPACSTVYRIDPERVPADGTAARCRECGTLFRVDPAMATGPGSVRTAPAVTPTGGTGGPTPSTAGADPAADPGRAGADEKVGTAPPDTDPGEPPSAPPPAAPVFGPQDPDTRARRLARALVSDIKVYNPEKWAASLEQGTLRVEFREEILKSWDEYVEQVGESLAKKSPYFRDALNDILASGKTVF